MNQEALADMLEELVELPVSEFVLHRKPMLLLDRVTSLKEDSASCEWRVGEDGIFFIHGLGVPSYIGIEYMAQCMAVHGGACERARGLPPPRGLLLGTRRFQTQLQYFVNGVTYQATCKTLISNAQGMSSYDCRILLKDEAIAKAVISVLQKPQGDFFNE